MGRQKCQYLYYQHLHLLNTLHRAQKEAQVGPNRILTSLVQVAQNAISLGANLR